MKDRRLDNRLFAKAAKEKMKLTPQAEESFRDAMESAPIRAAKIRKPDRAGALGWKLAALPWAVVGLVMLLLIPHRDVTDLGLMQQPMHTPMNPVTQSKDVSRPQAQFDASLLGSRLHVDAAFRNNTQDIWLVQWSAQWEDQPFSRLLWLEPGAECRDGAVWQTGEDDVDVEWTYTGYRVTANMLHWVDGEVLFPHQEGYAQQQSLMQDAMDAGALILAPGEWENGQAGEMTLPMPAGCGVEDVLSYYIEHGMLQDGSAIFSGQEGAYFDKRNFGQVHAELEEIVTQTVMK